MALNLVSLAAKISRPICYGETKGFVQGGRRGIC